MIAILLADGFEEIEALTPVDVLRRAGLEVRTVAISSKIAIGAHGISVICDLTPDEVKLDEVEAVVFPGGMPGATNLDASPFSDVIIDAVKKNGGVIAAICAAPLVLGHRDLLVGKRATCFPGFEGELRGATVTKKSVTVDGKIITANGMGAAMEFSIELVRALLGDGKANELAISHAPAFVRYTEQRKDGFSTKDILGCREPQNETDAKDETDATGKRIIDVLSRLGVSAVIAGATRGPRFTSYEIEPCKGAKLSKIIKLFDEISLFLGVEGLRMIAPTEGKYSVTLEVPNKTPETVRLIELLESEEFGAIPSPTAVVIGKDVTGAPVFGDVAKMPHLLIAGATGMGKSVSVNAMIASLLYKSTPEELKLILIDPKAVEFNMYNGIPHLLVPVITDAKGAVGALAWALDEMERRYELLMQLETRNIDAYNSLVKAKPQLGEPLAKIIIIIDELADLMMQAKNPTEALVTSLAQKARAAGIHLIIGTQRPSPDVITGVVKANIPTRISCKVATLSDSRTILGVTGAEKLLSKGDMLYFPVGTTEPVRVQGAFISDDEVVKIAAQLRSDKDCRDESVLLKMALAAEKHYKIAPEKKSTGFDPENCFESEEFCRAVEIALNMGKISTSLIQRKLSVGYGKAACFLDAMEEVGIVSAPTGQKPRDVLISRDEWEKMLEEKR